MNRYTIAIADILKHKTLGIVSHQPGKIGADFYPKGKNNIYVRDINFVLHSVSADDCKSTTIKESKEYWKKIILIKNNAVVAEW